MVGGAQGYPVDVGPGLGAVTGVEVSGHALSTGDPEEAKWLIQQGQFLAFRKFPKICCR